MSGRPWTPGAPAAACGRVFRPLTTRWGGTEAGFQKSFRTWRPSPVFTPAGREGGPPRAGLWLPSSAQATFSLTCVRFQDVVCFLSEVIINSFFYWKSIEKTQTCCADTLTGFAFGFGVALTTGLRGSCCRFSGAISMMLREAVEAAP